MSKYILPFPESTIPKGGEFGDKTAPRITAHRGVDGANEYAVAVCDGTVAMNRWSDVLGWVIVIKDEKGTFWGYSHLRNASKFTMGKAVKVGDKLGVSGNTGSASRGRHIHFTCGNDVNSIFWGTVYDGIKVLKKRGAVGEVPKPVVSKPVPVTKVAVKKVAKK